MSGTPAEQLSLADYHADLSHVGKSMLDVFRRSRKEYRSRFVNRSMAEPPETPAMRFGRLFHLALLEPDRYASEVAVVPEFAPDGERWDRRRKDHKSAWELWEQSSNGKSPVDELEDDRLGEMLRAVYDSPTARPLMDREGEVENAIRWRCPITGLRCKARRDKISADSLIDIKTSADVCPEAFARTAARFGYHRQAHFYRWGHEVVTGRLLPFLFVCVAIKQPYEVAVYELDSAAMELGRRQVHESLEQLAKCMETGQWEAIHERATLTIALPRWTEHQDEWQAESEV